MLTSAYVSLYFYLSCTSTVIMFLSPFLATIAQPQKQPVQKWAHVVAVITVILLIVDIYQGVVGRFMSSLHIAHDRKSASGQRRELSDRSANNLSNSMGSDPLDRQEMLHRTVIIQQRAESVPDNVAFDEK